MKPGDNVWITKTGHPAHGQSGILLAWDKLDNALIAFVAGEMSRDGKGWPVYVLRAHHVRLQMERDPRAGAQLIEQIIDACEARGCPLRGIYSWAGPYKSTEKRD